jgi:uncharacterized protein
MSTTESRASTRAPTIVAHAGSFAELCPTVRRVRFEFDDDIPVHWVSGQPVITHIANVFNILLPPGERWFCRSFREALPRVDDEQLRLRVKAFIGQEAIHGRSHNAYLEHLDARGIPVLALMAISERRFTGPAERLPLEVKAWLIAAIEVYTAMLGAYVFETDVLGDAHPVMRDLFLWHLAEEIEHKSVAFDLATAIDPSYRHRVVSGVLVSAILFTQTTRLLIQLIRHDPDLTWRRSLLELWRERAQLRELSGRGRRALRQFLRRDYHPSQEPDPPNALAYFDLSPAVAVTRRHRQREADDISAQL